MHLVFEAEQQRNDATPFRCELGGHREIVIGLIFVGLATVGGMRLKDLNCFFD